MTLNRRGLIYFLAIDALLIAVAVSVLVTRSRHPVPFGLEGFGSGRMRLSSPAFAQNGPIPRKYTCDGEDVSPPLETAGLPDGTKSLALVVEDPDAPLGTWTHWTVWNVAPRSAFPEGSVPENAIQGMTSFGKPGYGGPCPPAGTHRYFFRLYALDIVPSLPPSADVRALEAAMEGHVLDRAGLVGTYRKD
jgi:Raf kinase inhibitor-like YbhB/YbcL family protein